MPSVREFVIKSLQQFYQRLNISDYENKIESISVNGTPQTITGKNVNLSISSGSSLPSVSSSDNGKILQVVNGTWTAVTPTQVYSGTATPNNANGSDGDLYVQTEE